MSKEQNVDLKVDGNILTITVDLSQNFGKSTSGKSITIASTRGAIKIEGDISVNLNVYRKA